MRDLKGLGSIALTLFLVVFNFYGLRFCRLAELEMSQQELAEKVGKTPNTITRICNNESQPTLKLLRDIAITLNIDIRELLVHSCEYWKTEKRRG